MPSALLHPLVAACMAFAPAAPTSEPAPAAEPAADAPAADAEGTPGEPVDPTTDPASAESGAPPADDDATPEPESETPEPEPEAVESAPPADATAEPAATTPAERQRPETASAPPPRENVVGPPSDGRRDDIVRKALLGGGLGSLGLGLGLAGVSAWFWVERSQADRNIDELAPGANQDEARDQRTRFNTLATATAVAGGVYVVTGVALLLLHARDRKRVSATPTVGTVNGVVVQGRF